MPGPASAFISTSASASTPSAAQAHPLDALAEEIAALAGQIDAATHALLARIRAFDQGGGWARQGALSCAHWLGWRIGLAPDAAREKVRVARALAALPLLDEALCNAEVSYSKVRALTRIATPENESRLLVLAKSCTAAQLETLCRRYGGVIAGIEGRAADTERWVRQRWTDSGMVRLEAQLLPDEAALVMKAIEAARERLGGKREPHPPESAAIAEAQAPAVAHVPAEAPAVAHVSAASPAVAHVPAEAPAVAPWPDRADALIAMAEGFMAGAPGRSRSGGERYTVVMHVGPDEQGILGGTGAMLEDGTRVPAETLRRVACDAGLVPVAEGARGETLDVGRRRRTIPPAVRRALERRDRGCRFPGCTNRQFVDAHHLQHWIHGGRTALDNLVSLCGRHHRLVHEDGFQVRHGPNGTVIFTRPDGTDFARAPAPVPRAALAAALPPSAAAPIPKWSGERIDHALIVSVMLGPELEQRAAGRA